MQLRRGFRVIRHENRSYQYAIHEVVYAPDGKLISVSEQPVILNGMSVWELMNLMEMILDEIDRPAVNYELFPKVERESGPERDPRIYDHH